MWLTRSYADCRKGCCQGRALSDDYNTHNLPHPTHGLICHRLPKPSGSLSHIGLGFGNVSELKAKLNFTQRENDFN